MSGVDEVMSFKKNPDEDFYALLNCDENSTVSIYIQIVMGGFSIVSKGNFYVYRHSLFSLLVR